MKKKASDSVPEGERQGGGRKKKKKKKSRKVFDASVERYHSPELSGWLCLLAVGKGKRKEEEKKECLEPISSFSPVFFPSVAAAAAEGKTWRLVYQGFFFVPSFPFLSSFLFFFPSFSRMFGFKK